MSNENLRNFPMYDEIIKKINDRASKGNFSINSDFKTKLCNRLCSLQKDHTEQIALLIIHYYFLTDQGNPFIRDGRAQLPYGIKENVLGKGCSFDIDQMPVNLQLILGIYCGI